ncbi:MAG: short-chain fatty acyl-CoA regulator family protein [Acidiphilium sp.]|nr:short-chain fatty acyl-CoA regulator family protein [Acidiphilium sp.]MDD4936408.1 short-chain fatty acyl-CoA regulator family protein [Acidiphilium sp.]
MRDQKLYAGARLRKLREDAVMRQAHLAVKLGLSPSYLNQIESDRRPIPARSLPAIAALFGVAPTYFGSPDNLRQAADLCTVSADPIFGHATLSLAVARAAVRDAPDLTERFLALYGAYRTLADRQAMLQTKAAFADQSENTPRPPYDEVRDWVQSQRNYVHDLDRVAEAMTEQGDLAPAARQTDLEALLLREHRVRLRNAPGFLHKGTLWQLDRRGLVLHMAEEMTPETRAFCIAHVIGLLQHGRLIGRIVRRANLSSDTARALARVALANYFAGALIMPYRRFLQQAEAMRYDIQRLQTTFRTSFEQVCHRLSTLQRPGFEGIPFFFLKTDASGNVLKRSSATRFQFDRFGGPCPLWNVYQAFAQPGRILVQLARTPDDVTYLSVARTVGHAGGSYLSRPRVVAVGLGCEIEFAARTVYAAGLDLHASETVDLIGPGCRICARTTCRHRALPPVGRALDVGSVERGVVPYRILEG